MPVSQQNECDWDEGGLTSVWGLAGRGGFNDGSCWPAHDRSFYQLDRFHHLRLRQHQHPPHSSSTVFGNRRIAHHVAFWILDSDS